MTEDEYILSLSRIEQLVNLEPKPGAPDGDELDRLVNQVHAYEEQQCPMGPPASHVVTARTTALRINVSLAQQFVRNFEQTGQSPGQLAAAAGGPEEDVGKAESGNITLQLGTLSNLAAALGCRLELVEDPVQKMIVEETEGEHEIIGAQGAEPTSEFKPLRPKPGMASFERVDGKVMFRGTRLSLRDLSVFVTICRYGKRRLAPVFHGGCCGVPCRNSRPTWTCSSGRPKHESRFLYCQLQALATGCHGTRLRDSVVDIDAEVERTSRAGFCWPSRQTRINQSRPVNRIGPGYSTPRIPRIGRRVEFTPTSTCS